MPVRSATGRIRPAANSDPVTLLLPRCLFNGNLDNSPHRHGARTGAAMIVQRGQFIISGRQIPRKDGIAPSPSTVACVDYPPGPKCRCTTVIAGLSSEYIW